MSMVNPPHHRPRDDENEKRTGPGGTPSPNLHRTSQGRHSQPQKGRDPYKMKPGQQDVEAKRNEPYGTARPKHKAPRSAADEVMDAGMGRGKGKKPSDGGGAAPVKKGGCGLFILETGLAGWGLVEILRHVVG